MARIQSGLTHAHATATARAYWREWLEFVAWCDGQGFISLPATPDTIVEYLADRSTTLALTSLHRKLAAISCAHALCAHDSPTRAETVRGAIADIRSAAARARLRKAGLTPDDVIRMVRSLPHTLQGDRDRCIILLGYATSLRRAALASLTTDHVDERPDSLTISVDGGPPDHAHRSSIVVPRDSRNDLCAVTAYRKWMNSSGIDSGPLFRWITRHGQLRGEGLSDKAVSIVVKRAVALIGKDPDRFAANSLRSSNLTN